MESADYWIQHLNLKPHPEGGFYAEVYRSNIEVGTSELPPGYESNRKLITSIYYLLRSSDVSKMHRLKSDEMWYFHYGSPAKIVLIDRVGKKHSWKLGSNLKKAENFFINVPAGNMFAAEVLEPDTYSLFSCVVSPGFEFDDYELFEKVDLIQAYPQHAALFEKFC